MVAWSKSDLGEGGEERVWGCDGSDEGDGNDVDEDDVLDEYDGGGGDDGFIRKEMGKKR